MYLAWSWNYWDKNKLAQKHSIILVGKNWRYLPVNRRFLGNGKKVFSLHYLYTLQICFLFKIHKCIFDLFCLIPVGTSSWWTCRYQSFASFLHSPSLSRSFKNLIDILSNVVRRSRGCEGKRSKTAQHRLPTNLKYTQCRSKKTDAKWNDFSLVSSFLPISNLNSCWPLWILKPSGATCGFLTSNCFTSTLPAASTLVSTHSANDPGGRTPVGQQPLREQTGLSGLFWDWTKAPDL